MNSNSKSRAIKLLVCMLAMAIITSCLVAGTLAKYSTQKTGTDGARVAKFGVVLSIADTAAFEKSYTGKDGEITVLSDTAVVAPGTSDDGGLTFFVKGKPEVDTHINVDLTVISDVFLKNGDTYYRPIVFTLWQIGDENGDIEPKTLATGDIATVSAEIDKQLDADNDAGKILDRKYQLTWAWSYEATGENKVETDIMDTLLGDIAAGEEFIPAGYEKGVDYSIEIGYKLTIAVTQID